LTDLVVFGRAAGLRAAEVVRPGDRQRELQRPWTDSHLDRFDRLRNASGSTPTASLRAAMQHAMQEDCAVFRTEETMRDGVRKISKIYKDMADIRVTDRGMVWNTDLMETLEFDNLIQQAAVTVNSAVNRQESRGAHAREDFQDRDDATWMKHTLAWLDPSTGAVTIDYRPVHTYTMSNDVAYIQPKARVY
jgi:succinate dehydrogenase / fumarate reductase flavoprotein subunit